MTQPILKVIRLSKIFGGLLALNNINLEVDSGKIVGIIGPNGAGKTTLFNCLSGLIHPSDGRIIFQDLSIVSPPSVNKLGFIKNLAFLFFIFSLIWMPLFWSFFLPRTFFKVELIVATLFLFLIRGFVSRGLKQFQVWAWGVAIAFLVADLFTALWWISHLRELGVLSGTLLPLSFAAIPWSLFAVPFTLVLIFQLSRREIRELYGFRTGADAICGLGISRTFQNIRLFMNLSVLDNVKIGSHIRLSSGLPRTLLRTGYQRTEENNIEKQALEYLEFVGLKHRFFDLAGTLAYGEQRRLEIARALASTPKLLLLDEPAAGMNPQESAQLVQLIRKIREREVTILIIEHDMKVMMNLADKIYVLDHGELIAQGTPDEIKRDQKVIEAYLGGAGHAEA